MKKLLCIASLFLTTYSIQASNSYQGQLTNNGNMPINVIMYGSNYIAATKTNTARGRINSQGMLIPAGQNANFVPGTLSIDIFYGNGTEEGLHVPIQNSQNYTISPGSPVWTVTQDIR